MSDQKMREALGVAHQCIEHDSTAADIRLMAEQFVALSDTRPADNAEEYLRQKYGAYRGHQEWRALEEAFLAGSASRSAAVELTDAEIEDHWWGELDNRSLSAIRRVIAAHEAKQKGGAA